MYSIESMYKQVGIIVGTMCRVIKFSPKFGIIFIAKFHPIKRLIYYLPTLFVTKIILNMYRVGWEDYFHTNINE